MSLVKSDYLHTISNVMRNSEFRQVFDTLFNDWGDIKATVMVMKTYAYIEKKSIELGYNLTPEEITEMVRALINNSESRKTIVDNMMHQTQLLIKDKV